MAKQQAVRRSWGEGPCRCWHVIGPSAEVSLVGGLLGLYACQVGDLLCHWA